MNEIPIRIMGFDIEPARVKEGLAEALPLYGLSMTLPYLEPYLIRTMREALKHTTDPKVEAEVRQFIGQEAQHYKQHTALNNILRDLSPKMAGIQHIEDQMEADYQRFTNTKSLKFNLAYAEGFEAATFSLARCAMDLDVFDRFDVLAGSDIVKLFKWHMQEEVEHRTVTFNIYKHLYGDYLYRLVVGAYGQIHFFRYVFRFSTYLAKHSDGLMTIDEFKRAQNRQKGGFTESFLILSRFLNVYSPWYDPGKIQLKEKFADLSKTFNEEALEIRLPDQNTVDA